jgi:hypothetical protein
VTTPEPALNQQQESSQPAAASVMSGRSFISPSLHPQTRKSVKSIKRNPDRMFIYHTNHMEKGSKLVDCIRIVKPLFNARDFTKTKAVLSPDGDFIFVQNYGAIYTSLPH